MHDVGLLIGRILPPQIFIIAGVEKIVGYADTAHYMAAYGVPGALLPLVILLEVGGGIVLLVGGRRAGWPWPSAYTASSPH